jgi:hypothetical protein
MPPHWSPRSSVATPFPCLPGGEGVARRDLIKFQPMREALQQLRQGADARPKVWLYPRPSCLNCPSSEELSAVEVDSRIHKVVDLGVDPNLRTGPPLCKKGLAVLGLVYLVLFR